MGSTEKKQVIYMVNTSCRKIEVKPWEIIVDLKLVRVNKNRDYSNNEINSVEAAAEISLELVPEKMRKEMGELLNEFNCIFANTSYDIECTDLIEHAIITDEIAPIRHRPYRTPFNEIKRHLNEMIKN